jgi:prevent-host-death family protein
MNKIIGVTELQRKFRAVFDEVARDKIPYVLTRGSRPEAVMIPYDQYVKLAQADEAGVVQRLNRSLARMAELNAHMTEAEIEADLDEAAKSVPRRRRKI